MADILYCGVFCCPRRQNGPADRPVPAMCPCRQSYRSRAHHTSDIRGVSGRLPDGIRLQAISGRCGHRSGDAQAARRCRQIIGGQRLVVCHRLVIV